MQVTRWCTTSIQVMYYQTKLCCTCLLPLFLPREIQIAIVSPIMPCCGQRYDLFMWWLDDPRQAILDRSACNAPSSDPPNRLHSRYIPHTIRQSLWFHANHFESRIVDGFAHSLASLFLRVRGDKKYRSLYFDLVSFGGVSRPRPKNCLASEISRLRRRYYQISCFESLILLQNNGAQGFCVQR